MLLILINEVSIDGLILFIIVVAFEGFLILVKVLLIVLLGLLFLESPGFFLSLGLEFLFGGTLLFDDLLRFLALVLLSKFLESGPLFLLFLLSLLYDGLDLLVLLGLRPVPSGTGSLGLIGGVLAEPDVRRQSLEEVLIQELLQGGSGLTSDKGTGSLGQGVGEVKKRPQSAYL